MINTVDNEFDLKEIYKKLTAPISQKNKDIVRQNENVKACEFFDDGIFTKLCKLLDIMQNR